MAKRRSRRPDRVFESVEEQSDERQWQPSPETVLVDDDDGVAIALEVSEELIENEKKPDPQTEEQALYADVVKSVSTYKMLQRKHGTKIGKLLEKDVEELLDEYHHNDKLTEAEKKDIASAVYLHIVFLIPSALKKCYSIPKHLFDDAMQNNSAALLQAIELFNPDQGYTFRHYNLGYFRSALAKTFSDMNVIRKPNGKGAYNEDYDGLAREAEDAADTTPDRTFAMSEYSDDVLYSEMGTETQHTSTEDIEHEILVKQLGAFVARALAEDSGVLTPDERTVVMMYFGICGYPQCQYGEISAFRRALGKGCSYSRISQLFTSGMAKLRESMLDFGLAREFE